MMAAPPSTAPGSGGTRRLAACIATAAALLLLLVAAAAPLLRGGAAEPAAATAPTQQQQQSTNDDSGGGGGLEPPAPSPPTPFPDAPPSPDDQPDFPDGDDPGHVRAHWALVVAGSSGWGNYRHQSDAFHAYRVLTEGGLAPERVVLMAADDVAHSPNNPSPGKVFNHPRGPDNYRGGAGAGSGQQIPIDYRGADVNSQTFAAVLEGDSEAVRGVGTGRVVASGPQDRLFLFYSDHGSVGVLGMPSGPFLFADELHASLTKKAVAGGFKEMVLYVEACEAGSMFQGLMRDYDGECGREDGEGGEVRCEEEEEEDDDDDDGDGDGGAGPAATATAAAARTTRLMVARAPGRRLALAATPAAFFAAAASADSVAEEAAVGRDPTNKNKRKKKKKGGGDKGGGGRAARLGPPIFATTAANADESSWATYCPSYSEDDDAGASMPSREHRAAGVPDDTCLGDLYSVAWMEDSDHSDLSAETLSAQFALVRERTSDGGTYGQGSHAMAYGAVRRMGWEVAGDYLGMLHTGQQRKKEEEEEEQEGAGEQSGRGGRALLGRRRRSRGGAAPAASPSRSSHPHRLRQHEAYAAPLIHAARRARLLAKRREREAAAAAVVAAAAAAAAGPVSPTAAAVRTAAELPAAASSSRRALLEQAAAAAAATDRNNNNTNNGTAPLAVALAAAREAEAAAAAAAAADAAVQADQSARRAVDVAARRAARLLLREGRVIVRGPVDNNNNNNAVAWDEAAEEALLRAEGPLFSRAHRPDLPAVDDWDCLRAMVGAWDKQRVASGCPPVGGSGGGRALGQYVMRHTRLLAALCNARVGAAAFERSVEGVPCAVATPEEETEALGGLAA